MTGASSGIGLAYATALAAGRHRLRRCEIDLGYALCLLIDVLGLVTIRTDSLIPQAQHPVPTGDRPVRR